ncbi:1-acyl-sn-glycerol-3-phosphate acyltransferase [Paraburkholderia sp. UCT31]|nr:1-acyl-sn-glycerol-3-phosphate acyltransferase [Paraburkholderia sp. UCT31]
MSNLLQRALLGVVRLVVGAYPRWVAPPAAAGQTIYFANHTSHVDTLAVLAALPLEMRATVRPVAARDYWDASPLRRFIATRVLRVVFVDRQRQEDRDPLEPLRAALAAGSSLILFPEGKRNESDVLGEFKSGIFRLAEEFPDVHLVPVYLSNLNRVMPRGKLVPIPVICRVGFGEPLERRSGEDKKQFLARAREAVHTLQGA